VTPLQKIPALVLLALAVAAAPAAAAPATLKVTYWPHGRAAAANVWTLKCDPPRGTHPARRLACSALARHTADLRPATRACTLMPTATSAQARITGTWGGRRVDRSYRIGCPGWTDLRVVLTGR
jgi:Subtilisin inhibitor-like